MSKEKHLEFLKSHQPLPDDRNADDSLFRQLEQARIFFTDEPCHEAVSLLINALGNGDGHGIYPMVETTLLTYPDEVVIAALKNGLRSEHHSVRYWSAQFAANYPSGRLLEDLVAAFSLGDVDTKIAAITAIESIGSTDALDRLAGFLKEGQSEPVAHMIREALGRPDF